MPRLKLSTCDSPWFLISSASPSNVHPVDPTFVWMLLMPPPWLNDARTAMPALILMSVWGVGNAVVIYLAGLQDVPRELYEAADIDGALESVSDMLALEISKTFDFYRATAEDGDGSVQKILISGGGSKLRGLTEFLSNRFEMPVERLDPFRQIKVDARRFDPEYMREVVPEMAVAVGLALRGVDA